MLIHQHLIQTHTKISKKPVDKSTSLSIINTVINSNGVSRTQGSGNKPKRNSTNYTGASYKMQDNSEKLLTVQEVAKRLGINTTSFYKYKAKFQAYGLQPVFIGKSARYRESSVDLCIKNMAEKGVRVVA